MKIGLTKAGAEFVFKPAEFLGGEKFGAYRTATTGAKFCPARKAQVTKDGALATRIVTALTKAGFTMTPESAPAVEALKGKVAELKATISAAETRLAAVDAVLAKRGMALYGYQKAGVKWLAARTNALLADDMGLGKTVQVLVALEEGASVLVVGPAVAKAVWEREAAKWRPEFKVSVLSGRGSFRWPGKGEIVVTNYDVLSDSPGTPPPGVVVVSDEAHALKNYKAKRSKRFNEISKAVRAAGGKVWLLTATPMLNRPGELFSVLSAAGLEGEAFGGWRGFCRAFNGYKGAYGMEWGEPLPEVPEMLRRVSLRREKKTVLTDLPEKRFSTLTVETTLSSRDSAALDAIAAVLGGVEDIEVAEKALKAAGITFEEISRCRALLAASKIAALTEFVEEYEEAGEPLVVFSAHLAPLHALGAREGWAVISGETSTEDRKRIEDAFQEGKLKGVAASIKAGGVAITLTRASNAVFVDEEWSPKLNDQAADRIYRIGQKRGVLITRLVAKHALDARVAELLGEKTSLIGASVEASSVGADEAPSVEMEVAMAAPPSEPPPSAPAAPELDPEIPF